LAKSGAAPGSWQSVNAESIDTRRPYWCKLPSGRQIALFFYHGGVAQEVAFNGLLNSGKGFARRLMSLFDANDTPQLSHIATDGESYGHHHRFGEMALADALNLIEDNDSVRLTNYGQYLELFPPEWEVEIHENSSWSCVHGVERWRNNCGCNSGRPGWHQLWRKPLRNTLDWLRDSIAPIFEREGLRYLKAPWGARNDYIAVMLDRSEESVALFLKKHARRTLSDLEEVAVLRLLEAQRFAVFMYTSCGWFFDEISGLETNQILQYALRAMDYMQDVVGVDLRPEFVRRLSEAPSNVYPSGAAAFLQNVVPTRVTLERVAMHFAVSSLFEDDPGALDLFNYTASVEFFEKIEAGTPQFAAGRLRIRSRLSHAERTFSFAVLYLGQQHIIGNISEEMNRSAFEAMFQRTGKAFKGGNLGEVIGTLQEYFGPEKFTLSSLFADEKRKIIRDITEVALISGESTFRNVFNDNYQLMGSLEESGLPLPDTWKNIATYVLNLDLQDFFEDEEMTDVRNLRRIASDLQKWNVRLGDEDAVIHAVEERIYQEVAEIDLTEGAVPRVNWLSDVLEIVYAMGLKPTIWRSQNVFYLLTKGYRKGLWAFPNEDWQQSFERLAGLLKVRLK
jgi:hypothetical protein